MKNIIEVHNLKKSYKNIEAVKGINFAVAEGSFFALLGENGAGKSTTINIIATLLKKSSGEVVVNDRRVDEEDNRICADIGVVFQGGMLDRHLTVRENIENRAITYGLTRKEAAVRIQELEEAIGIREFLDRRYGNLSGGQKRRADIARALIHRPKLLILDEPTTGLDPYTRKCVWYTILGLRKNTNLTVFLTTHYMEEAAGADTIVIMDRGEIISCGTPEELRLKYSSDKLILLSKKNGELSRTLGAMGFTFVIDRDRILINLKDSFQALGIVESIKHLIDGFELVRGNLDDVFINITGQSKEEAI